MERRWVLVLGSSSGFGAAACLAFARAGYDILGVHLDMRKTLPQAEAVVEAVREMGREVCFFNVNASDDEARARVLAEVGALTSSLGGSVAVLVHSLAFGSLAPLVAGEGKVLRQRQVIMTMEVMAHSLAWWTRDLVEAGLMGAGGRIFAMTSSGSLVALPHYGAVSAAKSALESHVRQIAVELAPRGITANAIMAGVTDTPALRKIPGWEALAEQALRRNPSGRLTTTEDVAEALVDLARPGMAWLTGNVLRIDGGETIAG